MARFGDTHTVCWVESDYPNLRLRLARVDANLRSLEPSPFVLSPAPGQWTIDLASGPGGGMLAFLDDTQHASVLPFGPNGLPLGAPIVLGLTSTWDAMISVRPWDDGWIVAWGGPDGLTFAFLDSAGVVLPPGAFETDAYVSAGLSAVEGPDGTGLLCWRQGYNGIDGIHARRVAPGIGPIGDPFVLGADSPYQQHSSIQDLRNLASAWTGSRYAVLWDSFYSTGDQLRSPYGSFPTCVSWLAEDGTVLDPSPRVASHGTLPMEIVLHAAPGGHLAVVREREIDEFLHVFQLDADGRPLDPAVRHATFAPPDSCGPDVCFYHDVRDLTARPRSGGIAAGYACSDYRWAGGEIHDQEWRIAVDRFDSNGGFTGRAAFAPGIDNWDDLISFDFAMLGDTALVFCATDDSWLTPNADRGWVHLVDPDGVVLRTWELVTTGRVRSTAMAPLGDGRSFLLVWADDYVPQSAVLDVESSGALITGQPLLMGLGELRTATRLIAGPDQFLWLVPLRIGGRWDVYATRFDASGAPLAAGPSPVFAAAGDQWDVDGAWDGFQYLVTCASYDDVTGTTTLLGNRVGSDGAVYDGDGFVIDAVARVGASVSADGAGRCLVGYDGNHVRTIDDPGPLSGIGEGGSPVGTEARSRELRLFPNPTTGEVHLAVALPRPASACVIRVLDAVGREVAVRSLAPGTGVGERLVVWDGRVDGGRSASSGVYFLRVEGNGFSARGRVLVLR
jgi:hypothetical protein